MAARYKLLSASQVLDAVLESEELSELSELNDSGSDDPDLETEVTPARKSSTPNAQSDVEMTPARKLPTPNAQSNIEFKGNGKNSCDFQGTEHETGIITNSGEPSTSINQRQSNVEAPDISSSEEMDDSDADPDFVPHDVIEKKRKLTVPGSTCSRQPTATSSNSNLFAHDISSSEEMDDSDKEPDFSPVGVIENRQLTVPGSDKAVATKADDDQVGEIENPVQKIRSRKRTRNEAGWGKNVKSTLYNTGKSKVSKGLVRERSIKAGCTEKCRLKCQTNFDPEERTNLCKEFWAMNSKVRRQDFITNNVIKFDKKRCTTNGPSKRQYTLKYFFNKGTADKVQVCQRFFIHTLDITERMVDYNMKTKSAAVATPAKRVARNKTSDETIDHIKAHINSFNKVESHYCRADTKREYLDPSLNIRQLYRLYKEKCQEEGRACVKEAIYRKTFNTSFNLGFHVPSKDVCDLCSKLALLQSPSPQDAMDYESHLRRKEQARKSKEEDKQNVSNQNNYTVAEFDLQQVMTCPKLNVASAYYLRKLNVYNFTVLDLQDNQGHCYCWNEFESNRGTNDIVSALWRWLLEQDSRGFTKVILYSDTCGGQNRNRIFLTALIVFLENASSITCIEHKFFERGHSKMEADSMHSAIARQFEHKNIFLPSGYMACMASANKKKAYKVVELNHEDVLDFDWVNKKYMKQDAFTGIMKIHHIQCQKQDGDIIVKFSEEIGGEWELRTYRKRGIAAGCFKQMNIPKAYKKPCGIDKDKKSDLTKLMSFIPNDCQPFYQTLVTN